MSQPMYKARWYQRIIMHIAATVPGSWLLSRFLRPFDRIACRLTGGRWTITGIFTGLPIIDLTTRGARSGQARTCPLVAIPGNGGFVVIASNFGARKHPSWYYNLRANPDVMVSFKGRQVACTAKIVEGDARALYWRQAVAVYPGFQNYSERAGRHIPVFLLEPVQGALSAMRHAEQSGNLRR